MTDDRPREPAGADNAPVEESVPSHTEEEVENDGSDEPEDAPEGDAA